MFIVSNYFDCIYQINIFFLGEWYSGLRYYDQSFLLELLFAVKEPKAPRVIYIRIKDYLVVNILYIIYSMYKIYIFL